MFLRSETKNYLGAFCCSYTHNFHNRPLQPALLAAFLLASYILRIFPEVVEMPAAIDCVLFWSFVLVIYSNAQKVFDEMPQKDVVIDSYVGALELYLFREMLKMGFDFWQIVPKVSEFYLH